MLSALVDLLYPPSCVACAAPAAGVLCGRCASELPRTGRLCGRCALPVHPHPCRPRGFDSARSAVWYEGSARDALLRFKLGGERRAAKAFAALMSPLVPDGAVTFVPATRRSVSERGFNPAEVLAEQVAARGRTRALLRKVRETDDQAGLSSGQRRANLAGAFAPVQTERTIWPTDVVLIDDILTTGATAEACANALKAAGTRRVHVVTFARTR